MSAVRLSRSPNLGKNIKVSFEFFPPKSEQMEERLWQTVKRLEPLRPEFFSVTYGAGGSTRERTGRTVARILKETPVAAAAHLTCVDATRAEVDDCIRHFASLGISRFVALRGDPTNGSGGKFKPTAGGYQNAIELVAGLKAIDSNFDIAVAAYPEKHPESLDFATDIEFLKRKIDSGASRAITQCFFENQYYHDYVERVRKVGIDIPILPGILPIHNFWQVKSFCERNGTHIPSWLEQRFEGLENDPQTHALVAAAVAAEQVIELIEQGVTDFHFYTLNRTDPVYAICQLIGVRPQA